MESKVATYTEKNQRLQLLFVTDPDTDNSYFDVRFNRRTLMRFNDYDAKYARLYFCYIVQMICVSRQSPLSNMTS